MAIFHFSAKVVSRGKGQSAVAKAAYNAREKLANEKTGEEHDYTRAGGLVFEGIFSPKNAPEWAQDRERLWSIVEAAENRKDSQLARSLDIALPHELTDDQRRQLITDFVRENFVRKGMVADVTIHAPDRDGDERNHHAHVLLTMREIGPDGFGPKVREWNSPHQLETWRENWARTTNRYLERHGHEARIDHRSLEAQGIDQEPTTHNGPTATQMEREGERSERGEANREITARNRERERLKAERGEVARALQEAGRDQARMVWGKGDWEKWRHDDLSKLQGENRLLYALSPSGQAFASALEDKGQILARVTPEDVRRSENAKKAAQVSGAPERAALKEGDYYIVNAHGQAYPLNERTTGESKAEIEKRLGPLDQDALLSVGDARAVMHEVKAHRNVERRMHSEGKEANHEAEALGESAGGMVAQQREALRRFKESTRLLNENPRPMHPDEAKVRHVPVEANQKPQQQEQERQDLHTRQRREEERREAGNEATKPTSRAHQKHEEKQARTEQTDRKQGKRQSLEERLWKG